MAMFAKPDTSDAARRVAIAPGLSSGRIRLLLAAKIIVSLSLLAWILSRASLREIFGAVASASLPLLLAAYSVDCIGCLISVTRWRLLLRTHVPPPWRFLLQSYFVAAFFNNFLPSTVGGDASRAYDCYRASGGSGQAASSVVVDRLLGLLVLVLFALIALPLATQAADHLPELRLELGLGVLGLFGVILTIFFGSAWSGWHRIFFRLPTRLVQTFAIVWRAFASYHGQWRTLLKAFALSVLLQANVVLYFVLVARALHLEVPPQSFFLIVPLAIFVTMLPVSINGIGLRENALGAMLAWYGVSAADAVALAWLVYLSSLLFGLAGGIVYALRR
jgi:glycosyltransferase 2 family protein